MTKEAIEARRKYKREWAKQNRDKIRMYTENYWQRKADKEAQQPPEPAQE